MLNVYERELIFYWIYFKILKFNPPINFGESIEDVLIHSFIRVNCREDVLVYSFVSVNYKFYLFGFMLITNRSLNPIILR